MINWPLIIFEFLSACKNIYKAISFYPAQNEKKKVPFTKICCEVPQKRLYSVFPAVVGTVFWIDDAEAAATMFVLPWNKLRKLLSFRLKAPEFEKALETQLRPRYEAH